jgi:hypothetical protein
MFPEHNKRICDATFPPWIVVTSHSLYIVEIEPDNIRQEEKTLSRLAEMFAYRLGDLCQIVRPCDQANVDVAAGVILSTGDASVQPHSGDTTAQLFAAGLYLFEDIMKPFAFRPEELRRRSHVRIRSSELMNDSITLKNVAVDTLHSNDFRFI